MTGDIQDMKALLARVADGKTLTETEAELAFDIIMSGNATPSQMGGFLMALRVRGETVAEITGAARTMRAKMLRIPTPVGAIDTVGTGGDPEHNATALRAVLDGVPGPYRDIVLMNAAGALIVAGRAADMKSGVAMAAEIIDGGKAKAKLEALVAITNRSLPT